MGELSASTQKFKCCSATSNRKALPPKTLSLHANPKWNNRYNAANFSLQWFDNWPTPPIVSNIMNSWFPTGAVWGGSGSAACLEKVRHVRTFEDVLKSAASCHCFLLHTSVLMIRALCFLLRLPCLRLVEMLSCHNGFVSLWIHKPK